MSNTYTPSFPFPCGPVLFNQMGAQARGTLAYWYRGNELAGRSSATDGNDEIYFDGVNSGTFTAGSTQAGYEGQGVSTTGTGSGNQNAIIGTAGFQVDTGQTAAFYTCIYVPDPNVHAYSFWFGLFNKQVDPSNTGPTDGCWITGATASGAIAFVGKSANNSTVTTSATLGNIAVGGPRTVELAVVISENSYATFLTRDPTAYGNPWISLQTVANANMPRTSVTLRPHLVHYTNSANAIALQIRDFGHAWFRPAVF